MKRIYSTIKVLLATRSQVIINYSLYMAWDPFIVKLQRQSSHVMNYSKCSPPQNLYDCAGGVGVIVEAMTDEQLDR